MEKIIKIDDAQIRNEVFIFRESSHLPFSQINLGRDSRFELTLVIMPEVNTDITLRVDIDGEGAEVSINAVYLSANKEKVKFSIDIYHNVPNAISRQLLKGVVSGNAHIDFYGKIHVEQDAQKTAAYQGNHSVLLSNTAKVETKPQLEIFADDVKCTHGATIGNLNEEEQFYMRSRGLSLEDAKLLQLISFIAPCLEKVEDKESLIEELEGHIRQVINS